MIIDVRPDDLPLCPNQNSPVHPSHQLHVQIQDAAYNSNPTDENSEFYSIELDTMYSAISDKQFSGRMYLYKDTVNVPRAAGYSYVESWYFRCSVCGLVLPAVGKEVPF